MRNIGILKLSRRDMSKVRKVVSELGKAIDGTIFILPLDSELLLGKMARDELLRIQKQVESLLS